MLDINVHPDFSSYKIVYNLLVCFAEDRNKIAGRQLINVAPKTQSRKKRSRDEWEGEQNDTLFKEIYEIMMNEDVWYTFNTLIGSKIRDQIASTSSEKNSYYDQVINIFVDFKIMIARAEEIFNKGTSEMFYYYMLDEVGKLLNMSKHQILYFQLELNNYDQS